VFKQGEAEHLQKVKPTPIPTEVCWNWWDLKK